MRGGYNYLVTDLETWETKIMQSRQVVALAAECGIRVKAGCKLFGVEQDVVTIGGRWRISKDKSERSDRDIKIAFPVLWREWFSKEWEQACARILRAA